MIATLVIALREGLEAALIVSIIAAFLRRNGESLRPMWIGVALAILFSVAVGLGLSLLEQSLPQSRQEALETVIGAVAVFFVTGMIAWMNTHAKDMKGQLEAEAAQALGTHSVFALASMAFLAVLKEGFETAVFLLATFSAAQSAELAAIGAVIGLVLAAVIGWGIYMGGVKINLSRFFRITGAFLILVAAGLTITVLRTAHEAGWLNAGQQLTVDLSWLVAPGTIQSALITGVLGIPADPRLIEVIGWFAYLVPVALYVYWPASKRPGPRGTLRLQISLAAVLLVAAIALPLLYPAPRLHLPQNAPVLRGRGHSSSDPSGVARISLDATGRSGTLALTFPDHSSTSLKLPHSAWNSETYNGLPLDAWTLEDDFAPEAAPSSLTLNQVVALYGGRIPIGLNPASYPGPFEAKWKVSRHLQVRAAEDTLLDASQEVSAVVTLSGGGLGTPRTIRVRALPEDGSLPASWHVSPDYANQAYAALGRFDAVQLERHLWARQLPAVMTFIALVLLFVSGRKLIGLPRRGGRRATSKAY